MCIGRVVLRTVRLKGQCWSYLPEGPGVCQSRTEEEKRDRERVHLSVSFTLHSFFPSPAAAWLQFKAQWPPAALFSFSMLRDHLGLGGGFYRF